MSGDLLITVGVVGSGKSTWAKKWIETDTLNRLIVDVDAFRHFTHGGNYVYEDKLEGVFMRAFVPLVHTFVSNRYHVLVDDAAQFLRKDQRMTFVDRLWALNPGIRVIYKVFPVMELERHLSRRMISPRGLSLACWRGVIQRHLEELELPDAEESERGIVIESVTPESVGF